MQPAPAPLPTLPALRAPSAPEAPSLRAASAGEAPALPMEID